MHPTGDVYAMRAGDHLRRPETGPLVHRDDFVTVRRQFVTAVLTYDLPARLTRLRRIGEQATDPTIRHRALLEIAASIIRADDRTRYAEAHAALDQALRLPIPTKAANSDVHFLLARLERKASRLNEALDSLNQAIKLDGYFYHAHLDRLRLILSLEDAVAAQQKETVIESALQTGDVITVLEDRSYLLELQQVLTRHGQRRSLIRPFIEAYVSAARRDHETLATAIQAFGEACRVAGHACPRLLQARIEDLRRLQNRE